MLFSKETPFGDRKVRCGPAGVACKHGPKEVEARCILGPLVERVQLLQLVVRESDALLVGD